MLSVDERRLVAVPEKSNRSERPNVKAAESTEKKTKEDTDPCKFLLFELQCNGLIHRELTDCRHHLSSCASYPVHDTHKQKKEIKSMHTHTERIERLKVDIEH